MSQYSCSVYFSKYTNELVVLIPGVLWSTVRGEWRGRTSLSPVRPNSTSDCHSCPPVFCGWVGERRGNWRNTHVLHYSSCRHTWNVIHQHKLLAMHSEWMKMAAPFHSLVKCPDLAPMNKLTFKCLLILLHVLRMEDHLPVLHSHSHKLSFVPPLSFLILIEQ